MPLWVRAHPSVYHTHSETRLYAWYYNMTAGASVLREHMRELRGVPRVSCERGTLQVEEVEGPDAEEAARRHAELHFGGVGVDAPQPTDQYYKLLVDRCFYVGGMGSKCQAEVITAAEYMVRCTCRHCTVACLPVQEANRCGCQGYCAQS